MKLGIDGNTSRNTKSLTNSKHIDVRLVITVFPEENDFSDRIELAKHPSHFIATIDNNGNVDLLRFH